MLNVKEVKKTVTSLKILDIKCDWCGKVIPINDNIRVGDITSFEIYFGYGSENDTSFYTAEICDNCFKKHLKLHMREDED